MGHFASVITTPGEPLDSFGQSGAGSDFFLIFLNIAWIIAVLIIYFIFSDADRRRRELIRSKDGDSENSEETPKLLPVGMVKLVIGICMFLAADSLILLLNGHFLSFCLIFASLGYIFYSFNEVFLEAGSFFKRMFS